MAADASISFDISLELGKIKTAIDNTSRKVKADFEKAFQSQHKNARGHATRWPELSEKWMLPLMKPDRK